MLICNVMKSSNRNYTYAHFKSKIQKWAEPSQNPTQVGKGFDYFPI